MPYEESLRVSFVPLTLPDERESLAAWLSTERWPFHSDPELEYERALRWVDDGVFQAPNNAAFWVMLEGERAGLIHLFDLEDIGDGARLFDLRIRNEYRGRGLGTRAVRWLTDHLFEQHAELERIEGTTRADNLAMRSVFCRCGYAKEAHHRQSWPGLDGRRFDTVGYGILRQDWERKTITQVDWYDDARIPAD